MRLFCEIVKFYRYLFYERYTSSESFSKAGSAVIKGLEQNGYSRQDLRENTGKIVAEKEVYKRLITDKDIQIPYISLKGKSDSLAFNRDLIGEEFRLDKYFKPIEVNFHEDQKQKVRIDIDKENGLYRITQGKLSLTLYPEDFSIEEVGNWLKRNVRNRIVSAEEMSEYLDMVLADLSKTHTVEELSLNRFRLKERLQEEIPLLIKAYAKKKFDELMNKNLVSVDSAFYSPNDELLMSRISPEHFQKHLFERAGNLNGEETELAMRLDVIENVHWWFRSREKEDFYLQGWQQGKFYPDFIVKTKEGRIIRNIWF